MTTDREAITTTGEEVPTVRLSSRADDTFRLALEPSTFAQLMPIAKAASMLRMGGVASPEEALLRIMRGRSIGLTSIQSLEYVYVINGKTGVDASVLRGLAMQHPECERFHFEESTDERATVLVKRRGQPETRFTWTIEDAQRAQLATKDIWKKYPKAMLRARVSTDATRAIFPDAVSGMTSREELVDSHVESTPEQTPPQANPPQTRARAALPESAGAPASESAPAATTAAAVSAEERVETVRALRARFLAATTAAAVSAIEADVRAAYKAKRIDKADGRVLGVIRDEAIGRVTAPPVDTGDIPHAKSDETPLPPPSSPAAALPPEPPPSKPSFTPETSAPAASAPERDIDDEDCRLRDRILNLDTATELERSAVVRDVEAWATDPAVPENFRTSIRGFLTLNTRKLPEVAKPMPVGSSMKGAA